MKKARVSTGLSNIVSNQIHSLLTHHPFNHSSRILSPVFCILYSVFFILYSLFCILYSVFLTTHPINNYQ